MRIAHAAAIAALLAACGPEIPPPDPLPKAQPVTAIADEKDTAEDVLATDYFYDATGKRDPFKDPTQKLEKRTTGSGPINKCDGPLAKFALDALKLQLTIIGDTQRLAVIIDPTNRSNNVREGDCIGTNGGRIHAIRRDSLEVLERIEDPQTGRVFPVYLPLKMAVQDKDQVVTDLLEQSKGAGR